MQPGRRPSRRRPCLLVDFEGCASTAPRPSPRARSALAWRAYAAAHLSGPGLPAKSTRAHRAGARRSGRRANASRTSSDPTWDARAVACGGARDHATDRAAAHLARRSACRSSRCHHATSVPSPAQERARGAVAARGWSAGCTGAWSPSSGRVTGSSSPSRQPRRRRAPRRRRDPGNGRFMGRGLEASRTRVREPLLDLYVAQPATRSDGTGPTLRRRGTRSTRRARDGEGFAPATPAAPSCTRGSLPWHDARAPRLARMNAGRLAIGTAAAAVARLADELAFASLS